MALIEKAFRDWDEKRHPRIPKGNPGGGRFAKILYFGYGANLGPGMRERAPDARAVAQAVLPDHKLTVRGGVMNVEPEKGSQVKGGLMEISEDDLAMLDIYEGKPTVYYRKVVPVITRDGKTKEAVVYRMQSQKPYGSRRSRATTLPSDYYLSEVSRGYKDWGIPTDDLERAVKEAYERANREQQRTGRSPIKETKDQKKGKEGEAHLKAIAKKHYPDADHIDIQWHGKDPTILVWREWSRGGYGVRAFGPRARKK